MRHAGLTCCLRVLTALAVLLTSGCASVCGDDPRGPAWLRQIAGQPDKGWWSVRFKINWPEELDEPLWHMDVLLAHRVVSPALNRYRTGITLWRFHRRAARDEAGHRFSFVFYATPRTASKVYAAIRDNALLKALKASGAIDIDRYDDTTSIAKPDQWDTSDKHWSFSVQKSWPFFIMGVSEMWLDLISQKAGRCSKEDEPTDPEQVIAFYKQVNDRVEELWQREGGHALLHHLNAIFGYEPLQVRGKGLMRF